MSPRRLTAIAVVLALAVTGCSGGGDDDDEAKDTETSAAQAVKPEVDLIVNEAELISPHKPAGPLEEATRDAVVERVERLLLITSAAPLVEGKAGGGFADLFTPDAGARASQGDRDVFFDENVPVFGELAPEEASVELTALAGTMDPATALVVARYRWNVTSVERPRDRIVREGELQLVPDDGEWKIAAYTIVVTRTVSGETSTTTATTR